MLSGGKGYDPAIIPAGVESLKMKHLTEWLFIYMVLYSYVSEPDRKKRKKKQLSILQVSTCISLCTFLP